MTKNTFLTNVFALGTFGLILLGGAASSLGAEAPKPLRVLLITGGCCHDYGAQKDILKKGIEERANVVVDQIHTTDTTTKPPLAILGNPDYPVPPGTPHGLWFEYLGLQSSGHGPQEPIAIHFTDAKSAITKGLED